MTKDEDKLKRLKVCKEVGGKGTVKIKSVRSETEEAEKVACDTETYEPSVIDHIRRCESKEQALEIIKFMEGRGKVEPKYAKQLRDQLNKKGLDSFGKRRKPGCYERGELV